MSLSFTDKLEILIRQHNSWIGLLFGLGGIFFAIFFLPNSDIHSYRFFQTPLLLTDGYVIATEETNCLDSDTPIMAIHYQYQTGNRSLLGSSYSSSLAVKAHDKVVVEYVAEQPSYSRIKGTINAPYPLWVSLLLGVFIAIGAARFVEGVKKTKQLVAIISDAFVVTANQEHVRSYKTDDATVYEWRFSYEYAARCYQHTVESHSSMEYNSTESIVVQRSAPGNAVLASNLPHFVREKLHV